MANGYHARNDTGRALFLARHRREPRTFSFPLPIRERLDLVFVSFPSRRSDVEGQEGDDAKRPHQGQQQQDVPHLVILHENHPLSPAQTNYLINERRDPRRIDLVEVERVEHGLAVGRARRRIPALDPFHAFPLVDHQRFVPVVEPRDVLQPDEVHRNRAVKGNKTEHSFYELEQLDSGLQFFTDDTDDLALTTTIFGISIDVLRFQTGFQFSSVCFWLFRFQQRNNFVPIAFFSNSSSHAKSSRKLSTFCFRQHDHEYCNVT